MDGDVREKQVRLPLESHRTTSMNISNIDTGQGSSMVKNMLSQRIERPSADYGVLSAHYVFLSRVCDGVALKSKLCQLWVYDVKQPNTHFSVSMFFIGYGYNPETSKPLL